MSPIKQRKSRNERNDVESNIKFDDEEKINLFGL